MIERKEITDEIQIKEIINLHFIERVKLTALQSKAKKRKVGALIVENNYIVLSSGHNRMFDSIDNNGLCENDNNETFGCVIHAEEDAIIKSIRHNFLNHLPGTTLYCTYSPCMNCAKLIVHSGISRLVYIEKHPKNFHTPEICNGISVEEFLLKSGVEVIHCIDTQQIQISKFINN